MRNARAEEVVASLQPLLAGGSAGASAGAAVSGPVKVSSDPGTNAVLVLASPRDTLAVRAMLAELDAPRRQIYIEAMVLEVLDKNSRELGTSWHLRRHDRQRRAGAGSDGQHGAVVGVPETGLADIGGGFVGGLLGSPLTGTILGETVPSLGLLVKATASSGQVEVLASPHLTTLDNKPAKISVGSNIPYLSQGATASALTTRRRSPGRRSRSPSRSRRTSPPPRRRRARRRTHPARHRARNTISSAAPTSKASDRPGT